MSSNLLINYLTCSEYDFFNDKLSWMKDIFWEKYLDELKKLTEQDTCAMFKYGCLTVIFDYEKSIEYFRKCILNNSSWGYIGLYLFEKKEKENKKSYLEEAVRLNNIVAPRILAMAFYEKDKDKAIEYYEKSAELGDYYSNVKLSKLYTEDYNSPWFNLKKGLEYKIKINDQNCPELIYYKNYDYYKTIITKAYESYKLEEEIGKKYFIIEDLKIKLEGIKTEFEEYKFYHS